MLFLARYATVLTEDPGLVVLTQTCRFLHNSWSPFVSKID